MKTTLYDKMMSYALKGLYPTFKEWKHKVIKGGWHHYGGLYPTFKEWKR